MELYKKKAVVRSSDNETEGYASPLLSVDSIRSPVFSFSCMFNGILILKSGYGLILKKCSCFVILKQSELSFNTNNDCHGPQSEGDSKCLGTELNKKYQGNGRVDA